MPEEADFIRTIQADPNNDSHRLVYADWLEERGDKRGEFLRLKCQQEQLSNRLEQLGALVDREWVKTVLKPPLNARKVRLQTGRMIYLEDLRQSGFYAGLLEGLPTREMNRERIERILAEERNRPYANEPYLIQPIETPIVRDSPYRFGEPASIPGIACVGGFQSPQVARDETMHASYLVVVWFQDEFALPIEPDALDQLQAIDWQRFAHDFQY
jgi:uncharacterized protein (TIGR02996 family)